MSISSNRDIISITSLSLRSPVLLSDLWQKPDKSQPLFVSLSISTDVQDEATTDSLLEGESLNYGVVTKTIEKVVSQLGSPSSPTPIGSTGISLEELAEILAKEIIFTSNGPNVSLQLSRPRALLSAASIAVHITRSQSDYYTESLSPCPKAQEYHLLPTSTNPLNDKFVINGLRRTIIIGLNACELIDEQEVIVDLEFGLDATMSHVAGMRTGWQGWRAVIKALESHLTIAKPLTIEAITTSLAQIILTPPSPQRSTLYTGLDWNIPSTTVRIAKPCALMYAKYPAVQITRSRNDFFDSNGSLRTSFSTPLAPSAPASSVKATDSLSASGSTATTHMSNGGKRMHSAILGIGSNIGERMGNIARALKNLESDESADEETRVIDTSFLYESEAMYVVDQAKFLNAVVRIETTLTPLALLIALKSIESSLGREKTIRNGPRIIDLDILFYDDLVYDSRADGKGVDDLWLKIPHASIAEREFVLRPLADLSIPPLHPLLNDASPRELLSTLLASTASTLYRVLPLTSSLTHTISSRTLIMSILNATPDSFSDGGDNSTIATGLATALSHIELGMDIIDIGGMSTRPGASDVEIAEEIARVVPLIKAIRECNSKIPISIDTFRPQVAAEAIKAGATIINDVMGGTTEGMLEVMARLDVPVILMHSRGNLSNMTALTNYREGLITGVRQEILERVNLAIKSGVKRWNIIIDPGIGFAKTGPDNLVLLRRLPELLVDSPASSLSIASFPSLVGLSRKKFLGTLTGKDNPKDRLMATATGVTSSIAGGADIVRVHDAEEMRDVVKVADGIYRP